MSTNDINNLISQAAKVSDLIDPEDFKTDDQMLDQLLDGHGLNAYDIAMHANFCKANGIDLHQNLQWIFTCSEIND